MDPAGVRLERAIEVLEDVSVFLAYNANVDAIVRVDSDLEAFLERPDEPGTVPPVTPLTARRDLAGALTHAMAAGRGDEAAMSDDLAATLEADLEADAQQMGGQAGIMTNLVSALGGSPVIYTYLLSERQFSQFDHPEAVRYPCVEDGSVRLVPLAEAVDAERTKINWVFEFREGDELFDVRATGNARFIAASRPPAFDLHTGPLDETIDQVGDDVDGALLAGYHNLTPDHVEAGYGPTQRHARDVLRRLRSGGDLEVHVEYVTTHDAALRASIAEWILPEATVIGIDAHELAILFDDADLDLETVEEVPTDTSPFESREALAHYRMLEALRDDLGVDCIRLHAMEYHLAVIDDYLPPEAVGRGLSFAAVAAATTAARGAITAPGDLQTGLTYEPSSDGRDAIDHLADHLGEDADDGTLTTPAVVARPNRVVDDPAGTVGIGDIVSASSFVLELAASGREIGNEKDSE